MKSKRARKRAPPLYRIEVIVFRYGKGIHARHVIEIPRASFASASHASGGSVFTIELAQGEE